MICQCARWTEVFSLDRLNIVDPKGREIRSKGTEALCTFLPQWAEAPIQQSQDKADDYG